MNDIDILCVTILIAAAIIGLILALSVFDADSNILNTITIFLCAILLGCIFIDELKQSVNNFSDENEPIAVYSFLDQTESGAIRCYDNNGVIKEVPADKVIVKSTDESTRLELHKFTDPNSNRYAYRYIYYLSK